MREKCVFSELVKSDDDAEGIVAYGVYKYKKLEEAKSQSGKMTPEELRIHLKDYHDRFFDNQYEMGKAKDAATIILNALRFKAREALAEAHKKEIEKINNAHKEEIAKLKKDEGKRLKAAIKKDRDEWISKVDKTQLENKKFYIRWFLFAWSGVPSAVATFIGYAAFTFLLIVLFTPSDKREAAYQEATDKGREFLRLENSSSSNPTSSQAQKKAAE